METICPKCKNKDRPDFNCNVCNGFGYTDVKERFEQIESQIKEMQKIIIKQTEINIKVGKLLEDYL